MGSHASSPINDSQRALDAFRRIVRALRESSRTAESRLGVSGAQLFVVQVLAKEPALSLGEVAQRTLTHQSSVSVVVQRLVARGFVSRKRSTSDARRVELSLTASGRRLLQRSEQTPHERLAGAVTSLSDERRRLLAETLEDVVSQMDLEDRAPSMFFEDRPAPVKRSPRHART